MKDQTYRTVELATLKRVPLAGRLPDMPAGWMCDKIYQCHVEDVIHEWLHDAKSLRVTRKREPIAVEHFLGQDTAIEEWNQFELCLVCDLSVQQIWDALPEQCSAVHYQWTHSGEQLCARELNYYGDDYLTLDPESRDISWLIQDAQRAAGDHYTNGAYLFLDPIYSDVDLMVRPITAERSLVAFSAAFIEVLEDAYETLLGTEDRSEGRNLHD